MTICGRCNDTGECIACRGEGYADHGRHKVCQYCSGSGECMCQTIQKMIEKQKQQDDRIEQFVIDCLPVGAQAPGGKLGTLRVYHVSSCQAAQTGLVLDCDCQPVTVLLPEPASQP